MPFYYGAEYHPLSAISQHHPREAAWLRAQYAAEPNHEYVGTVEHITAAIAHELDSGPEVPAEAWHALHIPNGDYGDFYYGGHYYSFRIHHVLSGPLAGKRIIKIKRDGPWKGFGYITRSGGFKLWTHYEHDAGQPYVRAARYFIDNFVENGYIECRVARRCYWCNGPAHERGHSVSVSACEQCIAPAPHRRVISGNDPNVIFDDPAFDALLVEEEEIERRNIPPQLRERAPRASRARRPATPSVPMCEVTGKHVK